VQGDLAGAFNAALTIPVLHPLTISRALRGREDVLVRRVGGRFQLSLGALLAVLATHALAQPATRPAQGLRPAFEDASDDTPQRVPARRPARRSEPRAGALPNFDNPESSELPQFGNPAGSGASRTGFVSTNIRRSIGPNRRNARRPGAPPTGMGLTPPLSLTAPGTSPTAVLLRSTAAGNSVRSIGATGSAEAATVKPVVVTTPAAAPPRSPLLRIPDGTATGGIAGTVNRTRLTTASTTLLRRRTAVEEDAFAPLGLRPGAFLVLPSVEVTGGYDTNPARTPNGRASPFVTVSPEVVARSDWTRHEVTASLRGGYTAYDKTPELDRPAFDGKITGRLDVTRNTALIGEGILIVGTDNPGSPNVQAGLTRFPIYTTLGGTFGLTQRFNRVEVTVKGTAERTEYQESKFTDGTTGSNSDRDYNRFGGTLRTSYDLMPGLKPFVEAGADTRRHDLEFDRFGLRRDSDGWTVKGGSTFDFSRRFTGEASIGWINRKYEDASLQELNGFLFDASLIHVMSALTRVKLTAQTVASETTVPGTAGVLTRNAGVELEHSFRRWLVGAVKFNYGLDDYVGSPRKDDRYSIGGTLVYKLNRWAQAKAEIRQEWLRSTVPGADYDATIFMLGMKFTP
jgi:hypothetical protein